MDCKIFIIEFYNKEGQSAPRDAHSREEEICRKRPRSARECAKAHSFFIYANKITPLQIVTMKFTTNHSKFPVKFPTGKKQLRFENTHVKLRLYVYVKFE